MWIVFGNSVSTRRVPGGARVQRRCGQCDEDATFYEKEVTATFRLYFIDVFDYRRHRVMSCGCCGACYATDELGVPAMGAQAESSTRSLGDGVDRAAQRVGGALERAAGALEAGISSLFSDDVAASRAASREEEEVAPPSRDADDPLEDPLEARFRELERKAGLRHK